MFDHHDHQEAEYAIFKLGQSVDDVMTLASRGEAERAALRTEEGAILDAWRRLGNLVETLGFRNNRKAA